MTSWLLMDLAGMKKAERASFGPRAGVYPCLFYPLGQRGGLGVSNEIFSKWPGRAPVAPIIHWETTDLMNVLPSRSWELRLVVSFLWVCIQGDSPPLPHPPSLVNYSFNASNFSRHSDVCLGSFWKGNFRGFRSRLWRSLEECWAWFGVKEIIGCGSVVV